MNKLAVNRKLGRPTDQRLAILRNQTTDLILHNQIETTEARAKEVKSIVDSISNKRKRQLWRSRC